MSLVGVVLYELVAVGGYVLYTDRVRVVNADP
jgi:hypothetical protein